MLLERRNIMKKVTFQKPFGSRRKGRPKLRWIDDIEADLKNLGVRGWRIKTLDKDEWRDVLEETKARTTLQPH
jgi:hypothetical protein